MANIARKALSVLHFVLVTSVEILVSLLLTLILTPFAVLFWLVNEIFRLFATAYLRIRTGSRVALVPDGADCIWAYEKPGNGRMVVNVTFYKEPLDLEEYKANFMSRVIHHTTTTGYKPYEKLMRIFTERCGYYCWEKDDYFSIDKHVRIYPGMENKVCTESDLLGRILPDLFHDMDETKPQWEEVIVPQFQYNNATGSNKEQSHLAGSIVTARVFRYHHGYMDGASNLLMWTHCMSEGADFPYPVNPLGPSRTPTWKRYLYNISCFVIGAWTMIKSLYIAGNISNRFVTKEYSGRRIFAWSEPLNVSLLKEIKSTTKVTLPTVISAVVASALRNLDQNFPSRRPQFCVTPEETVIGLVGALLPYPNTHLRNRFTVVHFPILTGPVSRLQRVQAANKEMNALSRNPISYLNFFMFKYFGRFPAFVLQLMMSNAGLPVVFSNVPMTTRDVAFWDNPIVECVGWTPLLTNTGLGILTLRYSDHLRFCAVTDEACLSEKELTFFLSEVQAELKSLADECIHLRRPSQIIIADTKTFTTLPVADV